MYSSPIQPPLQGARILGNVAFSVLGNPKPRLPRATTVALAMTGRERAQARNNVKGKNGGSQ